MYVISSLLRLSFLFTEVTKLFTKNLPHIHHSFVPALGDRYNKYLAQNTSRAT